MKQKDRVVRMAITDLDSSGMNRVVEQVLDFPLKAATFTFKILIYILGKIPWYVKYIAIILFMMLGILSFLKLFSMWKQRKDYGL